MVLGDENQDAASDRSTRRRIMTEKGVWAPQCYLRLMRPGCSVCILLAFRSRVILYALPPRFSLATAARYNQCRRSVLVAHVCGALDACPKLSLERNVESARTYLNVYYVYLLEANGESSSGFHIFGTVQQKPRDLGVRYVNMDHVSRLSMCLCFTSRVDFGPGT